MWACKSAEKKTIYVITHYDLMQLNTLQTCKTVTKCMSIKFGKWIWKFALNLILSDWRNFNVDRWFCSFTKHHRQIYSNFYFWYKLILLNQFFMVKMVPHDKNNKWLWQVKIHVQLFLDEATS